MGSVNYYISVGEPWDFTGPDGENIIKGKLLKVLSKDCIIFQSNYEIEIDGVKGDNFVLQSRYNDSNFNTINKEGSWTVGVGILLTNTFNEMNCKELEKNSKYVIIGALINL